jgi:hypothetical protein
MNMNIIEKRKTAFRKTPILGWLTAGLLVLAGILLIVSGCNSEPTVRGTVQIDGQLLHAGSIRFVPAAGTRGSDAGAAIRDGSYQIEKGLRAGEYKVVVHATRKTRKKTEDPGTPGRVIWDEVELIPPEYNDKSKLVYTVKEGANTFDVPIEGSTAKARSGK